MNDLENSLRILKTEYFDLYQLHGMKTKKDYRTTGIGENSCFFSPLTPSPEIP